MVVYWELTVFRNLRFNNRMFFQNKFYLYAHHLTEERRKNKEKTYYIFLPISDPNHN